jgi:ribonuclease Z
VMMFRAQNENTPPLNIIGPPGIGRFVRHVISDLGCHITFPYNIIEWREDSPEEAFDWFGVSLKWFPLDHSIFCLGYRLDEPNRPGRFDLDKALALGVPKGPLFGQLQRGCSIALPEGRTISPQEVLGPPRPGRSIAFATDTRPCPGLDSVLQQTDIAFIEGMFADRHSAEAAAKKHMTCREAVSAAKRAGVPRVVLVHLSPRYTSVDEAVLQSEAQEIMTEAEISRQLAVYSIPLKD